jgi:iron complex transport system substrate-binding protein
VTATSAPTRVVSLLPAATDIVASLGATDRLVGRTHECDWPAEVASVEVVTSSPLAGRLGSREIHEAVGGAAHRGSSVFDLDGEALARLTPDLIITQELCAVCAVSYAQVSEAVRSLDSATRVLSLEPATLDEVLGTVQTVGAVLGETARASRVVADAKGRLARVRALVAGRARPRVAVLEWLDPLMPGGHWVPDQVDAAGGVDVLAEPGSHSEVIDATAVAAADPDVLLLAPCGMPRDDAEREARLALGNGPLSRLRAVRSGAVWLLDGPAYFNRPGPRVVRGVEVLAHVLHGVLPAGAKPVSSAEAARLRDREH